MKYFSQFEVESNPLTWQKFSFEACDYYIEARQGDGQFIAYIIPFERDLLIAACHGQEFNFIEKNGITQEGLADMEPVWPTLAKALRNTLALRRSEVHISAFNDFDTGELKSFVSKFRLNTQIEEAFIPNAGPDFELYADLLEITRISRDIWTEVRMKTPGAFNRNWKFVKDLGIDLIKSWIEYNSPKK